MKGKGKRNTNEEKRSKWQKQQGSNPLHKATSRYPLGYSSSRGEGQSVYGVHVRQNGRPIYPW